MARVPTARSEQNFMFKKTHRLSSELVETGVATTEATFNALLLDNPWPQRWMIPMSLENALSEVAGICVATDEYPGLFRSPITAIETQAFDEPCCRRRNRRQKALDLLLDILWQAQFRQDELLERRLLHCAKIPWFDPKRAVTRAFSRQYVGIYARCC